MRGRRDWGRGRQGQVRAWAVRFASRDSRGGGPHMRFGGPGEQPRLGAARFLNIFRRWRQCQGGGGMAAEAGIFCSPAAAMKGRFSTEILAAGLKRRSSMVGLLASLRGTAPSTPLRGGLEAVSP